MVCWVHCRGMDIINYIINITSPMNHVTDHAGLAKYSKHSRLSCIDHQPMATLHSFSKSQFLPLTLQCIVFLVIPGLFYVDKGF